MGPLYSSLPDESSISKYIELMNKSPYSALDVETTGLDRWKDSVTHIVCYCGPSAPAVMFEAKYAYLLKTVTSPLILHNFKFDFMMLSKCGVVNLNLGADTMLLHHLYNENLPHDLDSIVKEHWKDNYKEVFWSKYKTFDEASETDKLEYACKDVVYTYKLYEFLQSELLCQGIPDSLIFHTHELAKELYETEMFGLRVDFNRLRVLDVELKSKLKQVSKSMFESCKEEIQAIELEMFLDLLKKYKTEKGKKLCKMPQFNFKSSKQLGNLLYSKLKLPVQKNRKKVTTDENALLNLEGKHPVIALMREHRSLTKIIDTYIQGTIDNQNKGRVYPRFNINGTVTGRISSSNPNIQQIPSEGGIRSIYIPDDGCVFISADFSSLEVVIAAHYSQDKNLLKIINEGASKHDITAEGLGVDRATAKKLNFAAQYGAGAWKLGNIVGKNATEGQYIYDDYWKIYGGEKKIMDKCAAAVDDGRPIVSLFGRSRRFPKAFSGDKDKKRAYRQAYNALIQGTGSDITHRAFIKIAKELKSKNWGRAMFEVHDEVVCMVNKKYWQEAEDMIKSIMNNMWKEVGLTVNLKCESSGPMDRWED